MLRKISALTWFGASLLAFHTAAHADISGTVFRDFNSDGVRDMFEPGVPGVSVKVYGTGAATGTLCATATSADDGSYAALTAGEQLVAGCSYINGAIGAVDEYRLEFEVPAGAGLVPSYSGASYIGTGTAVVTQSNTLIRIVGDGQPTNGITSGSFSIGNVNLALHNAGDFCPAYVEQANGGDTSVINPPTASVMLATPIAIGPIGTSTLPPATRATVVSYQYESGSSDDTNTDVNLPTRLVHATQAQTGAVRGMAYHRRANVLFAAAVGKRHTTFTDGDLITAGQQNNNNGPDTIFKIYRGAVPVSESQVASFAQIEAGSDTHDLTNLFQDNGYWDQVGRVGWGDVDLSDDDSVLFGTNMADKLLYRVPVNYNGSTGAVSSGAAAPVYSPVQLQAAIAAAGACNLVGSATTADDADWVLGGIKAKDGQIYFGVTCTAQALGEAYAAVSGAARCEGALAQGSASLSNVTTNRNAFNFAPGFVPLRAVVFKFDPTAPGAAPTLVTSVPMNYDRREQPSRMAALAWH
jgi:hypothetical protein